MSADNTLASPSLSSALRHEPVVQNSKCSFARSHISKGRHTGPREIRYIFISASGGSRLGSAHYFRFAHRDRRWSGWARRRMLLQASDMLLDGDQAKVSIVRYWRRWRPLSDNCSGHFWLLFPKFEGKES